jgi:hypothetical protein
MKLVDLTGLRFGRLRVLRRGPDYRCERGRGGRIVKARWWCICDCGNETLVHSASLRRGEPDAVGPGLSRSCGCLHREELIARQLLHGEARAGRKTLRYLKWANSRKGRKAGRPFETSANA